MTSLTLADPAGPEQADAPCFAQRQSALQRANEVRFGIARVKRELATGVLSFEAALEDERAQSMKISTVLLSLHYWGPDRTRKTLRRLRIGELKPVRELTERQRHELAGLIGDE